MIGTVALAVALFLLPAQEPRGVLKPPPAQVEPAVKASPRAPRRRLARFRPIGLFD